MTAGPAPRADLNADVGERGPGADDGLLGVVTTVHVACGGHAGDPATMRHTVARAVEAGVAVGAHPSYPDRAGFGRRPLARGAARVADDVLEQLGALEALAALYGAPVVSVKAHGALYHRLAADPECASAVAGALAGRRPVPALVLPALPDPPPAAMAAARAAVAAAGVAARSEAFCDRAYRPDASLVPRREDGAVISDPEEASRRARGVVLDGSLPARDGTPLRLRADTLCVHGDTPGSLALARAVRAALEAVGVRVVAPGG